MNIFANLSATQSITQDCMFMYFIMILLLLAHIAVDAFFGD